MVVPFPDLDSRNPREEPRVAKVVVDSLWGKGVYGLKVEIPRWGDSEIYKDKGQRTRKESSYLPLTNLLNLSAIVFQEDNRKVDGLTVQT